jgi:hypothetical protein
MKVRPATSEDAKAVLKLDKKFYGDGFFTLPEIKDLIEDGKIQVTEPVDAYLIWFKMPTKGMYITSLGGDNTGRGVLLAWFLTHKESDTYYTHAKPEWGMDLLEAFGFEKKGKGNPDDEEVPFGDDITKLWVYELKK